MLKLAVDHPEWILTVASSILLAGLAVLEGTYSVLSGKPLYDRRDTACNLAMFAGSFIINLFWVNVVFFLYVQVHRHSIWKLGQEWWLFEGETRPWEWFALFVLEDLCFYTFHRTSHRVRILWASHVNHHSSEKFNLTTALRQTWTPFLAVVFWIPLALIGFDPLMILTAQSLSLIYQSWLHTEVIGRLGPLEWIFNTPSHHRVHHGRDEKYVDRCFGGVLIVWDRLFGTSQDQEGPVAYGLDEKLDSYNPLRVAFHEWAALLGVDRKRAPLAVALSLGLLSSACQGAVRKSYETRTLDHLGALRSYHGVLSESGVLGSGDKLVSEISFSRPGSYLVRTLAPEMFTGTVTCLTGSRLVLYYPKTHYAIEFVHLKPLSDAEEEQLIKDQFNSNLDSYRYEVGAAGKVAGLATVALSFEAKSENARVSSGESQVYDELSFPLSMSMAFKAGPKYAFAYDRVTFNEEIPGSRFDFAIPKVAIVSRWDVDSPGYSIERVAAELGAKPHLPAKLPRELSFRKAIRQQGSVPAFTVLYESRPYFFNLTVFRDYGVSLIPSGRGLRLKDKHGGDLVPGPGSSTYSFVEDGLHYVVSTNLPLEEALRAVDDL